MAGDQADSNWDDYNERVLRNEGRLGGLESLVAEIRESDRKLIEQRSESLANELTARADAVLSLSKSEREADQREYRAAVVDASKTQEALRDADQEKNEQALVMLREIYDTSIRQNYEQSREAITALEERTEALTTAVDAKVTAWREADREARLLQAGEYERRLTVLNGANERQAKFQAESVTRELFSAEKEAQTHRENVTRDQILALDRATLSMTTVESSDKAHHELRTSIAEAVSAAQGILDQKLGRIDEKVEKLEHYRDTSTGRSSGYAAFYGWIAAGFGIIVAFIVISNVLSARGL